MHADVKPGNVMIDRSGAVKIMAFGIANVMLMAVHERIHEIGILMAIGAGLLGGLLMAVATITYSVDHIIAGTAILVMAPGIARYLSGLVFPAFGGSITQSPTIRGTQLFDWPFLAGGDLFGWEIGISLPAASFLPLNHSPWKLMPLSG